MKEGLIPPFKMSAFEFLEMAEDEIKLKLESGICNDYVMQRVKSSLLDREIKKVSGQRIEGTLIMDVGDSKEGEDNRVALITEAHNYLVLEPRKTEDLDSLLDVNGMIVTPALLTGSGSVVLQLQEGERKKAIKVESFFVI